MKKFYYVYVKRSADMDFSNGGSTSKNDHLVLFDEDWTKDEIEGWLEQNPTFEREHCIQINTIWKGSPNEYKRAFVVFKRSGGTYCAGGNFVYSCDSRFRDNVCPYPISVHDRFETWEEYELLSI